MWFPPAFAAALLFGIAGYLLKYTSHRSYPSDTVLLGLYVTGSLSFLTAAVVSSSSVFGIEHLIAGIVVGIGSAAGNILFMRALQLGPVSLTSPVVNINILLVVLMAVIVYGERLTGREISAIVLILTGVCLLPADPRESRNIKHKTWYLLTGVSVFLFFLRNGGLKITDELNLDNTLILCAGYFTGMVLFMFRTVTRADSKRIDSIKQLELRRGLMWGSAAGVFSFGGMQLYAHALALGPAGIVSPLFAANSLVTGLLAIVLLRERLTVFQTVAVFAVVGGIVLLRL